MIEELAEKFIILSQNKDNRVLKAYMLGVSEEIRRAIYKQLVVWDCHEAVDARLLKVKPKS